MPRAVDPDPHESAFIFHPGTGSESRREILKNSRKLVIIVIFLTFKSKFGPAPWFPTFEQSFFPTTRNSLNLKTWLNLDPDLDLH